MSEPSPADATDPAATRAQHGGAQHAGPAQLARPARSRLLAGPAAALENWRVSWRLIALIVVPTAMGLAFAGLQVSMAERNAQTMGRVERLATLGQQITGLAQAMEDERDDTAGFIAHARSAAGLARLTKQYVVTGRWAARVRPLVRQLGSGYPAQTQAEAAAVLSSIADLPTLRHDAVHGHAPALTAINDYTAATAAARFAASPVTASPVPATAGPATASPSPVRAAARPATTVFPSPVTAPNVIIPAAGGPGQGALPVYDSLESDWFRARRRGMSRRDEPRAGHPAAAPRPWTSPGDEGWKAAAAIATPSVGGMTSAGLPRRVPRANLVPGSAGDQPARTATMAESAQIARSRLANFQRGSRRARGGERADEAAKQLTPDD